MSLTEADIKNLRQGDIVLVPMVVEYANDQFVKGSGVKVVCRSTEVDHRPREEREKGPRRVDIMSRFIHSVASRPIKIGDWVIWQEDDLQRKGKVSFLTDNQEATVRRRRSVDAKPRSVTLWLDDLTRILPPDDLTAAEKATFK